MAKPPILEESQLPVTLPEVALLASGQPKPVGTFRLLVERTSITITVDIRLHLVIGALTALILAIAAAVHA